MMELKLYFYPEIDSNKKRNPNKTQCANFNELPHCSDIRQ